ncbi:MAG: DUF3574 domain-containing protein [Gammaproteobacteria bacterium]
MYARTELFFGLPKSDGSTISEFQFRRFLRETVTPLYPVSANSRIRRAESIREGARLVILLYPLDILRWLVARLLPILKPLP